MFLKSPYWLKTHAEIYTNKRYAIQDLLEDNMGGQEVDGICMRRDWLQLSGYWD